jgi:hypothetical protein
VNVVFKLDASITDRRRLLGLPDVVPLYELRCRLFEHWLVEALDRHAGLAPPIRAGGRAHETSGDHRR